MIYDVVVVGAGPAGCTAAQSCAKKGLSTLCIEEHGTIGYPIQCAGLLSVAAFDECRVSQRSVLNTVNGARLISSKDNALHFDAKKTKAFVVDRGVLDKEMAIAAADAGAEFLTKTALFDLNSTTVRTQGIHGKREFNYHILIAADGPRSTVARLMQMKRSNIYLAGIQADMKFDMDLRFVEIYPDASPEFFGYAIPIGIDRVRIGLCGQTNVMERFNAFRKKFGDVFTNLVTGTIPLGVMPKTYGNRTLFVGDAAGFVKPTSGGGVYTGIRSARHAASVAVAACSQDRFDDNFLAQYEHRWQADFGDMLVSGFRFFKLRQQLNSEDIDRLICAMNDPDIIEAIIKYGDMDNPVPLIKKLMLNPSIFTVMSTLMRSRFRSIFKEQIKSV